MLRKSWECDKIYKEIREARWLPISVTIELKPSVLEFIVWFSVIDDYSLVNFQPLDSSDEESINYALAIIDTMLQWGEDQDVKVRDEEERDFENEMEELSLNSWAFWFANLPTEKATAHSSSMSLSSATCFF